MIGVTVIRDNEKKVCGFVISGHAEFSEEGSDIVCSAVTALAFNTCNSIETLCDDKLIVDSADENAGGFLKFMVNKPGEKARLLLDSLKLGLEKIAEEYHEYVNITDLQE